MSATFAAQAQIDSQMLRDLPRAFTPLNNASSSLRGQGLTAKPIDPPTASGAGVWQPEQLIDAGLAFARTQHADPHPRKLDADGSPTSWEKKALLPGGGSKGAGELWHSLPEPRSTTGSGKGDASSVPGMARAHAAVVQQLQRGSRLINSTMATMNV